MTDEEMIAIANRLRAKTSDAEMLLFIDEFLRPVQFNCPKCAARKLAQSIKGRRYRARRAERLAQK